MIKSKDLRPGNLVKYTGKPYPYYPITADGIIEVEEVLRDGVNLSQGGSTLYESENLEGIALTPEWLGRCGFIIHRNGLYVNNDIWIEFKELSKPVFTPVYSDGSSFRGFIGKHIAYVHQLQNLYFALTGEELTIKEPA